jgi:hypothetical protein
MGGLLDNQSLYIHGVDDADKGAEACKVGGKCCQKDLHHFFSHTHSLAALYIVSMVLSIAYWVYYNKTQGAAQAVIRDSKQYGSFPQN